MNEPTMIAYPHTPINTPIPVPGRAAPQSAEERKIKNAVELMALIRGEIDNQDYAEAGGQHRDNLAATLTAALLRKN